MFHRSIADNIRVGRPGASDAEVRRAAQLAHAAEFVEALPNGYDTLVGERGVKLSGGQRQRIAIARAILKDAPDPDPRRGDQLARFRERGAHPGGALDAARPRTAIVIAHRLSTVRRMDELIILDAGRVAERGGHDALLAKGGVLRVAVGPPVGRISRRGGGMTKTNTLGPIGQISRQVRDIGAGPWSGCLDVLGLPHLFTFGTFAFFDCHGVRLFLAAGREGSW